MKKMILMLVMLVFSGLTFVACAGDDPIDTSTTVDFSTAKARINGTWELEYRNSRITISEDSRFEINWDNMTIINGRYTITSNSETDYQLSLLPDRVRNISENQPGFGFPHFDDEERDSSPNWMQKEIILNPSNRNRLGLVGDDDTVEWVNVAFTPEVRWLAEPESTLTQPPSSPDYITIGGEQFSTELTILFLSGAITNEDLVPLKYMTNLESLWLGGGSDSPPGQFTDLSPIAGLTNLRDLALDSPYLSDLSPLVGLTNLIMIQAWGTQIADLSPLAGLTNLDLLSIAGNHITDLSPISGLVNLTVLDLSFGQISDITPLSGLSNLRRLNLDRNQITDVSPLASLANAGRSELEDLNLRENQISDISPLAYLVSLHTLWIMGNPITDLSPVDHVDSVIFDMQLPQ